jgi:DNA-binding Xre family transcriptional regulator
LLLCGTGDDHPKTLHWFADYTVSRMAVQERDDIVSRIRTCVRHIRLTVYRSFVRHSLRPVAAITLRVREIRDAIGWSQDRLATEAGVTQATVSRLERGESSSIDLDVLDKISRALRVDPALLFVRQCP